MTTANDIIVDALEDLGYKAAEIPIEPEDSKKALRELNDMLAEWGESELLPGAAPVASLSTTIRAQRGIIAAIKKNLAGRCAASFRRPITPELAAAIIGTTSSMLKITAKIGSVKAPSTLPKGSGNECLAEESRFFEQIELTNF